jgi:hypothetical protein
MLSSRWIINAALLAAIAALILAGLYLGESGDGVERAGIGRLKPADVTRIRIRSGGEELQLRRQTKGWSIESPVSWPAYGAHIDRLLSILNASAEPLANAADANLATLGLQPPAASLLLNDTPLLFGGSNNIGERRYVLLDRALYLLPDVYLAFIAQGLPGLVDRRLLPRPRQLVALRLPGLDILREDGDRWRAAPAAGFSEEQLRRLADNWQDLQASRIDYYAGAADGDGQAIEARLQDGGRVEFRLLSSSPEIVIANPRLGLKYHFRSDLRDQLVSPGRADDDA